LGNKKQAVTHFTKVLAVNERFLDAKELLEQLNAPAGQASTTQNEGQR
jgi:hypothetical protein